MFKLPEPLANLQSQMLCANTLAVKPTVKSDDVYDQLIRLILHSGYVSVDETTVKLLDPDRPHKARDSWLWTYLGLKAQAIVLQFGLTRGAENLQTFILHGTRLESC